jgi:hypothetical protein
MASYSIAPDRPHIELSTLGNLIGSIAIRSGYQVNMPDQLASRPVVYRFKSDIEDSSQIRGLASSLSLDIELDSKKKILQVRYRQPKGVITKQDRISATCNQFLEPLRSYLRMSDQEKRNYLDHLQSLASSQQDPSEQERYLRINRLLTRLNIDRHRTALPVSLIETMPTVTNKVLSAPYTGRNRLPISSSALQTLNRCLYSQESDRLEFEIPSDFGTFWNGLSQESRDQLGTEIAQSRTKCVFTIFHEVDPATVTIELRAVTPYRFVPIDTIDFPLVKLNESRIDKQQEFDGYGQLFVLKMPFQYKTAFTLNAFGNAADQLDCNYIGWLSSSTVQIEAPAKCRLSSLSSLRLDRPIDGMTTIRAERQGDWLSIKDYNDPYPEYAADWKYFVDLKQGLDGKPMSLTELRDYLNKLGDVALDNLELIPADVPSLDESYRGFTRGVRLLRSVLNSLGDLKAQSRDQGEWLVSKLSDRSKKDVMGFMKSVYIQNAYPQMLHPLSASRLPESILRASVVVKQGVHYLHVELQFPTILTLGMESFYWRAPLMGNGECYRFDVPIRSD